MKKSGEEMPGGESQPSFMLLPGSAIIQSCVRDTSGRRESAAVVLRLVVAATTRHAAPPRLGAAGDELLHFSDRLREAHGDRLVAGEVAHEIGEVTVGCGFGFGRWWGRTKSGTDGEGMRRVAKKKERRGKRRTASVAAAIC